MDVIIAVTGIVCFLVITGMIVLFVMFIAKKFGKKTKSSSLYNNKNKEVEKTEQDTKK
ncbi:hypothetical protein ACXX84_03170 [Mycoplasma sp. AC157]|uniref:hypothetical protein n=1 Tax=Mycoplasma sp. 480 TaxID=3440155 RepID=UPI003F5185B7